MPQSRKEGGMSEFRRRLMMKIAEGGGGLPSEYQQVEYLESSGTQYILMPIPFQDDSEYKYDFDITIDCVAYGTSDNIVYGQYGGFYLNFWGDRLQWAMLNRIGNTAGVLTHDVRILLHAVSTSTDVTIYVNGVEKIYKEGTAAYTTISWQCNRFIFGGNYRGRVRMYELAITYAQTDKYHLIPCYRISDNEPGMYDLEKQVFLTNSGSGTFTVGPDV